MSEIQPVVVGIDDSDQSRQAVRWAARLAERDGAALVVLHAWLWPIMNVPLGPAPGAPEDGGLRNLAEGTVRDALAAARDECPGLEVTGRLVTATPTIALKQRSAEASLVVLGSEGLGRIGNFLLGSVGLNLAGHTECPLVVVRGQINEHGPVVVGVDDSPRSHEAIAWAFREAAARETAVRAVQAWSLPAIMPDWPEGVSDLMHETGERAQDALHARLEPFHQQHPEVPVQYLTPSGSAGRSLVEASEGAQLIVVGTRGRGGFKGLLLGSTTQTLLHRSACPVVVVPHHFDLDGADEDAEIEDEPVVAVG